MWCAQGPTIPPVRGGYPSPPPTLELDRQIQRASVDTRHVIQGAVAWLGISRSLGSTEDRVAGWCRDEGWPSSRLERPSLAPFSPFEEKGAKLDLALTESVVCSTVLLSAAMASLVACLAPRLELDRQIQRRSAGRPAGSDVYLGSAAPS